MSTTYMILAIPQSDDGTEAVDYPSQIHLKSGAIARPSDDGRVLVEAGDARALLAMGCKVMDSGGANFLATMILNGWVQNGPGNSFDGSGSGVSSWDGSATPAYLAW